MPAEKTLWYVYLAGCADGSFYCGITNNLERRFAQHNGLLGGGAKYTRGRRPVSLLGYVFYDDKSSAMKKEIEIKSWPVNKKIAFFKTKRK